MTTLTRPRSFTAALALTALPFLLVPTADAAPAAGSRSADAVASSAPAPSAGCHRTLASYRTLDPGDHGRAVRTLQCLLNDRGASPAVAVDGRYGPQTRRAVRRIEAEFEGDRPHPGRIDNGFWVLLHAGGLPERVLRPGDDGHAVVVLQRALRAAGADIAVDGDYGSATRSVVRAYQREHGIRPSGRVTADTRFILTMGGVFGPLR